MSDYEYVEGCNCNLCTDRREEERAKRRSQNDTSVPISGPKSYYGLGFLATWAMREDEVLPKEKVEQYWSDEFLTNVIVPILDHIRRFKWREFYRFRNTPENSYGIVATSKDIQITKDDAIAIQRTMDILREWRG